jgi:predicted nucleic acid-binding Zn ribbon protein
VSLGRLGDALGEWRPAGGAAHGDPLAAIRAAWPGIVGADVARSAQPSALAGNALVIVTASSAWSHQLAFLEPQIVRALRDLPEARTLERLRFRVGAVRAPRRGTASARRRGLRVAGGGAPGSAQPQTAEAALASFRAAVERARAAHAAAGGAFCPACGAFTETERACVPCADGARTARFSATERLLYEAPWLSAEAVLALVPDLTASEYDGCRRRLLRAWWDEMRLAQRRSAVRGAPEPDRSRLRKLASSYVLLETRIDPHLLEMDGAIRRNALGDLFAFIRAIEGAEEN